MLQALIFIAKFYLAQRRKGAKKNKISATEGTEYTEKRQI